MGAAFWGSSPWAEAGPFSAAKAEIGFRRFIDSDVVGLFVIDGDAGVCGALCVVVSDLWTVEGGVMAQEAFWWVEPAGTRESSSLLSAAEVFARNKGAQSMALIRLEGMRDSAVDRLYRHRGYAVKEHLYTRTL